jgi:hypothetical protein
MIRTTILCLLVASVALAFPASDSDAQKPQQGEPARKGGDCPGGYAEGAEIERGRLVFVCQGGAVVPKGCIAEDLSRLSIGSNYDTKNYRKACRLGSDGQLAYELVGCVANGQEQKVDSTWDDSKNFYTCKSDGSSLKIVTLGCVDGGKRINLKEKINKDDAVYSCEEAPNGGSKLQKAGCVKDGKQYNPGDSFEVGKTWFNCSKYGRENVQAKAAGCVSGGKRLNDGDRYTENAVILECIVEGGAASTRVVACVQNDGSGTPIERRVGCTWAEGTAPNLIDYQCQKDGETAKKVALRCTYTVSGGAYTTEPGCFRQADKGFIGCSGQAGGSLTLSTYETEAAASSAGLHAC